MNDWSALPPILSWVRGRGPTILWGPLLFAKGIGMSLFRLGCCYSLIRLALCLQRHIESELNDWAYYSNGAMPIFGDVAMRIHPKPLAQSHIYRGGPMPLALTPCRIDV